MPSSKHTSVNVPFATQSFQDKLDHIDKRLWRLEAMMMASTLTIVAAAVGSVHAMTKLVFALVVTLGGQTISTEYWSGIDTCLWYAKRLNSQHHHTYHRHHPKNESIHAKCLPRRVDPRTVEIFDH